MLPRSYQKWLAWLIVSFFYAYQYILRVVPSILLDDIKSKFDFSAEAIGQFSGVYYLGYSLVHLPLGALLDRFGPKKILPLFILLTVLGLTPLVFAEHWAYPVVGRFFVGIGSSAAILGVFKIIQISFQPGQFSRVLSLSVTVGILGAIYGGRPIHQLRQSMSFDHLLYLLMSIGPVLALLTFLFLPDSKHSSPQGSPALEKHLQKGSVVKDITGVLVNPKVVLFCILAGLLVGPLEGFADIWGTKFLKVVMELDDSTSSTLPSLIFLGVCVGGPILSFISDYFKAHVQIILGCALFMTFAFSLILLFPLSLEALTVLLFLVGVASSYQIMAIFLVSTFVEKSKTGIATATANMIIMIFGYVFHSLIGGIIGLVSSTQTGSQIIDARSLTFGIASIPACTLISAIGIALFYLGRQKQKSSLPPEECLGSSSECIP